MIVPSTGVADSITISIDDVKKIDEILISAKYIEQELNYYRDLVYNKDFIIETLENEVYCYKTDCEIYKKKYTKSHSLNKFFAGTTGGLFIVILILL